MTSLIARQVAIDERLLQTDLDVTAGELVALVGPNGGGKTSLLRALARIEDAGGKVMIDGEEVDASPPARRRRLLSFLPASRDMTWPISVRDVIALGLDRPDARRIGYLIEQFELERLAGRPVNRLSTGERARVLMARALAARPIALLLDEPMSNLDPYWVLRFLEQFRMAADEGQIVLVALHDLSLLGRFDRALLIADGKIQMSEAPANLMASERFAEIFRIRAEPAGGWAIRR
ncbi:ABC transporter ATP-binding protein [Sphingomonas sp. G124]|uniref:ABC transporter ATP-binding protein n=1 Tax=Sphingomonas cremea TaxID=2904799 RepID=A0A9X1QIW9_9SPHN|nr:ABC transporter ATP-binding protein [Sphingomonas cremea]MCF2514230.1 ABC transporter ATP-binding protein [Sphingomonas cremea]